MSARAPRERAPTPHTVAGGRYIFEDLHTCLHGQGTPAQGRAFGRCDQAVGQPSMFELLLVMSNASSARDTDALVKLSRRANLPEPDTWARFFAEAEVTRVLLGRRCALSTARRTFGDVAVARAIGMCGHVTAVVRKRGEIHQTDAKTSQIESSADLKPRWVHAAGRVRQRGRVASEGDAALAARPD